MKKQYSKPTIEVESYEVNTAIATGCGTVVSLGPGNEYHATCNEFTFPTFDDFDDFNFYNDFEHDSECGDWKKGSHLKPVSATFYDPLESACSCYLTAEEGTIFTS